MNSRTAVNSSTEKARHESTDDGVADGGIADDEAAEIGPWATGFRTIGQHAMGIANNGVAYDGYNNDVATDNVCRGQCGRQRWAITAMVTWMIGP